MASLFIHSGFLFFILFYCWSSKGSLIRSSGDDQLSVSVRRRRRRRRRRRIAQIRSRHS